MSNESITNKFASDCGKANFINFSNKEVSYKFMGTSFSFLLSQSLFSSFDIDSGSQLLLKSVATWKGLPNTKSILDIGSGVGTLGICAGAKAAKDCHITMEDRNALALLYSYNNAIANALSPSQLTLRHQLMFEKENYSNYDLILSNIPAKAGEEVIKAFLEIAPFYLNPDGRVAIVIVRTLATMAVDWVKSLGYDILTCEKSKEYTVMHYSAKGEALKAARSDKVIGFDYYCRGEAEFLVKPYKYSLQTVWNLPNFDTEHFTFSQYVELIDSVLKKHEGSQKTVKVAIINPEQGHFAEFVRLISNRLDIATEISCFSNDKLQLTTTTINIQEISHQNDTLMLSQATSNKYDLIVFNTNNATLNHEISFFSNEIGEISKKEGYIIVSATSAHSNFYQKALKDFSFVRAKKTRGFRTLLLRRK